MLTKDQRVRLNGYLWPDACRFQGWNPCDREKLYAVYARVLGHHPDHARTLAEGGRISSNDFVKRGDRDDFGAVKRELLNLAGLKAAPSDDPVKRSRIWTIQNVLLRCYRVYRPDQCVRTILADRFKQFPGINALEDLTADQLGEVVMTLNNRAHAARKKAGDSVHDMKKKAGVKCDCLICVPRLPMAMVLPDSVNENEPF